MNSSLYNLVNRIADFSGSDEILIINPVLSFITHLELLTGAAVCWASALFVQPPFPTALSESSFSHKGSSCPLTGMKFSSSFAVGFAAF